MPSTSKKQHNFMAAIAHSPSFAKKAGVSQSVGKDFVAADKGKKFRSGGMPAAINKQDTQHGKVDMPFKSLNRYAGFKAGGLMRSKTDVEKDQSNMGNMAVYKKGGDVKESQAMMKKEIKFFKKKGAPASMIRHEEAEAKGMKKGGMTKYARGGGIESRGKTKGTMVKMAGGGYVRSADGIASKGKTKGKMC